MQPRAETAAAGTPAAGLRRLAVALAVIALAAIVLLTQFDVTGAGHAAWTPQRTAALALLASGCLSGFLAGLLGIGGALITVPAMYVVLPMLGVPPGRLAYVVLGSSLCAMVPMALLAARAQWRHGALDGRWLRRLVLPMTLGAAAGAAAALRMHGPALALLFASQSLYYGCSLLAGTPRAGSWRARIAQAAGRLPARPAAMAIAGFCACAGMGSGSLLTPYLAAQGLTLRRAVATASALNLCVALGGALTYIAAPGPLAEVCSVPAVALLCGGALATVPIGVNLSHRLPIALFRRLLGGVTLISAVVVVIRAVVC
jgi:uncharacterized membrane protein YfcA